MTDKELRRLSRRELLEMLITQTRKVEQLEKQLAEANERLRDKLIQIEESGSLAEAVMRLNGVFEAAQNAAQQYLDNIKDRTTKAETAEQEDAHEQTQSEI